MASRTEENELDCRVLSIQSSVVYGYVGNKSATFPLQSSVVWGHVGSQSSVFPLQVLGFDVSTINSVQFSNHTGYGQWRGQVLNADNVSDLFDGLRINNLLNFSHILTGYIGKVSFLEKVGETVAEMKKTNPNLMFVCDPVMGDNGKFYVAQELVPVYRDKIVPQADIVTPNQFELEQLTGTQVKNEKDAFKAMEKLHAAGTHTVVLSSSSLGTQGVLLCLASTVNGSRQQYRLEIPLVEGVFVGTGDLFAATLLAWMHTHQDLKVAVEKTIATLQAVIRKTLAYAQKAAGPGNKPTPAQLELRLIKSKADIENPQVLLHAEHVSIPPSS